MTDPGESEPRSLAGEHLWQAVDALHASGNPYSLYDEWARADAAPTDAASGLAYVHARTAHARHLRTTCLFAALAAEAYVNEFLAALLPPEDWQEIDYWPTIDKYVKGTRKALDGERLFRVGDTPMPIIRQVIEIRDRLVHPKPGYGPHANVFDAAREPYQDCTPEMAARAVVFVAAAAHILVDRAVPGRLDFPATFIWHGRDVIVSYSTRMVAHFPLASDERQETLWSQIGRHLGKSESNND